MRADLHVHTTASDGRLTPEEIVSLAVERGLSVVAITDHDSVEGIPRALAEAVKYPFVTVIPGVEINTDVPRGEVHILGYFVDYTDTRLGDSLSNLRNSREGRARGMVDKLRQLGRPIEWRRVEEIAAGGAFGRPHIAQAMLEKGYITTLQEAFTKYIGRNGPAYVEREKVTPVEAVKLVIGAGGLAALAHPGTIDNLEELLPELIAAGIVGIEVWYNDSPADEIQRIMAIASENKLIALGGSDYHAFGHSTELALGGVTVPDESLRRLFYLAGRRLEVFGPRN